MTSPDSAKPRCRPLEFERRRETGELFAEWVRSGVVRGIDADTLSGVLAAIFVLQQNKDAFEGRLDAVMSWIVDAVSAHADNAADRRDRSPGMPAAQPVFKRCVRCGYSLRGLTASRKCPECRPGFDERCALFRATNPKQVLALFLLILGGGWVNLRNLPNLANLGHGTTWQTVGAVGAGLWVVLVAVGIWFVVRRYRRGFKVAITSDGLIVHLPGISDDLIPWSDIEGAAIEDRAEEKAQAASVMMKNRKKTVPIGGVVNVFPDRATVERFVDAVNERVTGAEVTIPVRGVR